MSWGVCVCVLLSYLFYRWRNACCNQVFVNIGIYKKIANPYWGSWEANVQKVCFVSCNLGRSIAMEAPGVFDHFPWLRRNCRPTVKSRLSNNPTNSWMHRNWSTWAQKSGNQRVFQDYWEINVMSQDPHCIRSKLTSLLADSAFLRGMLWKMRARYWARRICRLFASEWIEYGPWTNVDLHKNMTNCSINKTTLTLQFDLLIG